MEGVAGCGYQLEVRPCGKRQTLAYRAVLYLGPVLTGEDRAEVVVTLIFQDINGDGKPDMIILFKDLQVVFLNTGTGILPLNPNGK